MNKKDFALEDFKNIQDLIKFIDQKAGALLVIYGFIVTAYIDFAKDLSFENLFNFKQIKSIIFSSITITSSTLLVALLLYQIYFILFKVIQPKLAGNYCENESCIYYFQHIASMKKKEFYNAFNDLPENDILYEILGQVYEVANILKTKNENLCKALKFFYASIILVAIFMVSSKLI